MIIKQIYNNNVILSENEAGDEIILVGRGIAFGMTRGSKVVEGRIEKKFELQDDVGQKFKDARSGRRTKRFWFRKKSSIISRRSPPNGSTIPSTSR